MDIASEIFIVTHPTRKLSSFTSLFLMINGALGAGMLNFPFSFMRVGNLCVCIILEMIIGSLMIFSFFMIAYSTLKGNYCSYMQMVRDTMGKKFHLLNVVIITIYTLGSCALYVVIVGNQVALGMKLIIENQHTWYADRRFLMFITTFLTFFPFLLSKNLNILSKASIIGTFSCLYIVVIIAVKYFVSIKQPGYIPPPLPPKIGVLGVLNLFTSLIFGFQNHLGSVSILSEISNPSLLKFMLILSGCVVFVGLAYGLIGSCGMLIFGTAVNPDILLNFDPKDIPTGIGRFMIVLVLISSYSLTSYVGRLSLHEIINQIIKVLKKDSERQDEEEEEGRHIYSTNNIGTFSWYISATVWYLCCLLIGIFVPNISQIIPYVGGFAGFITLIGPVYVFMSIFIKELPPKKILVPTCMMCVITALTGGFMVGIATVLPIINK